MSAAAASLAVSRSTLKRFCRDHGISRWPLSKHNKRTANPPSFYVVVLVVVKIKRWSCSSKHHELSGKWWSCGRHDDPPYKLDSMYQVVRLMVSLQRWRTRNAMQKNDRLVVSPEQIVPCVVSVNNKASKKRKRIDLSSCFEEIRERYGKTREKAMNYFGVGTGKLRCILQWWSSTKIPKLIQAPVVTSTPEEAPTSVVAAQFKETMTEQFIENATASTVKILTIKATYNGNMVRFPFTLLDGLEKVKEMVATRFQLKPGSLKLKYEDKEGDEILIACDIDLIRSVGDSKPPVNLSVIRLLVFSVDPY